MKRLIYIWLVVNIVVAYSLVAEEINSLSVSSTYLAPGNSLKITYQVELASGTIKVYSSVLDSNGNTVRTLENGIERANGTYTIYWDGKDDNGNMVSDGTYTIKVRSAMGSIKSREWQLNDGPLNAPRDIAFEKDGKYAWVTLLIVAFILFLFRKIYAEVVCALPLNGGAYNALLNTTSKFMASFAATLTILSYMATSVISANEAMHYLHSLNLSIIQDSRFILSLLFSTFHQYHLFILSQDTLFFISL